MATESEILTKLNDLLATYDGALSISGGSKLLTLARTGTGDTAAVVIKQGTGERWRLGQFGADAFALQRSPTGAAVDYTDVISVNRSNGAVTITGAVSAAIAAGSAGAPGLAITGDTNTGIYSPGADQIGIATGGTARLVVAAGLVGVGTTSPVNEMDVNGAVGVTYADGLRLYRDTGTVNNAILAHSFSSGDLLTLAPAGNSPNSFVAFATATSSSISEKMRIDQLGRVGIGTSSPGVRLDVAGQVRSSEGMQIEAAGAVDAALDMLRTDTGARAWLGIPNWNPDAFYIYGPTANGSEPALVYEAGAWGFRAGGFERMRLDNAGRLLIGTSASGGSKLRISGLPTSTAGLSAGDVWNDGGTLKVA